jgi:hypothetical protein
MADIRTVIAVTGEDDRFEPVREAALDRARSEHATLILYDLDASESPLESPLPTGWSADGTEEEVGDRLGPEELDAAGRAAIAEQVRQARAEGIDAWGWLPDDPGRDELIAYAARQPGAHVLVPEGDENLSIEDLPEGEVVAKASRRSS